MNRRLLVVLVCAVLGFLYILASRTNAQYAPTNLTGSGNLQSLSKDNHQIDALLKYALQRQRKLRQQSWFFKNAIVEYRNRYGRHPPPGFIKWYLFAREKQCLIVDEFDQINDDLRPFWSISPKTIRDDISRLGDASVNGDDIELIRIVNGSIISSPKSNNAKGFVSLATEFARFLPDLVIPLNTLDRPRVYVPYETQAAASAKEMSTRKLPPNGTLSYDFTLSLDQFKTLAAAGDSGSPIKWVDANPSSLIKDTCFSSSTLKSAQEIISSSQFYIRDEILSKDICGITDFGSVHSALTAPIKATTQLIPLFSTAKLNSNSDILFPGSRYLGGDQYIYDKTPDKDWEQKYEAISWSEEPERDLPADGYVQSLRARFVQTARSIPFINARFSKLSCQPNCAALRDYPVQDLNEDSASLTQSLSSKYVADLDSETYSNRFVAYLTSKSAVIKSTIYQQWFDQRLIPWQQYIPLDVTFREARGVADYLSANDKVGKRIAENGRAWALLTLRKADMQVYLYRLLIEYARVIDEARDKIGYDDDGEKIIA